ncbi:MAG: DUF4019 domain-containing protein [Methylacidiphilales bacterium]|nr:DUF4019 domain-containing protein [Candidatus Methylacidiphilales bacterium]
MKVALIPSAWRKRLLVLAGISSLLFASGRPALATSGDSSDAALVAAKAWIAQIDAGDYVESYNAGCDAFHQQVTQQKWVMVLKAFRPSYGEIVSRREVSHSYKENGFNGMDGEYMIVTYDTTFSRLQGGYEKVVLKFEDGKWRGAYYEAGPKPSGQASDQPLPDVQTEVESVKTQHPQQ